MASMRGSSHSLPTNDTPVAMVQTQATPIATMPLPEIKFGEYAPLIQSLPVVRRFVTLKNFETLEIAKHRTLGIYS